MADKLFQTKEYFEKRFDVVSRSMVFKAKSVDEWRTWQQDLR